MEIKKLIQIRKIKIDSKSIKFTKRTRLWCQLPYPNHPKGCPNYSKNPNCPPLAKFMKKILLIEDNEELSKMYQVELSQAGYKVDSAYTGREGLNLLKQSKPDLILLDILLPKMDGFDLLRKIKKDKETANIPVVLLTNLNDPEDKELGLKLGATGYWVKAHYTPKQVVEKVQDIC